MWDVIDVSEGFSIYADWYTCPSKDRAIRDAKKSHEETGKHYEVVYITHKTVYSTAEES